MSTKKRSSSRSTKWCARSARWTARCTSCTKQDIKQMTLLTLSLMPADLEAQLDPQQMADLIAFIRGGVRERAYRVIARRPPSFSRSAASGESDKVRGGLLMQAQERKVRRLRSSRRLSPALRGHLMLAPPQCGDAIGGVSVGNQLGIEHLGVAEQPHFKRTTRFLLDEVTPYAVDRPPQRQRNQRAHTWIGQKWRCHA